MLFFHGSFFFFGSSFGSSNGSKFGLAFAPAVFRKNNRSFSLRPFRLFLGKGRFVFKERLFFHPGACNLIFHDIEILTIGAFHRIDAVFALGNACTLTAETCQRMAATLLFGLFVKNGIG